MPRPRFSRFVDALNIAKSDEAVPALATPSGVSKVAVCGASVIYRMRSVHRLSRLGHSWEVPNPRQSTASSRRIGYRDGLSHLPTLSFGKCPFRSLRVLAARYAEGLSTSR